MKIKAFHNPYATFALISHIVLQKSVQLYGYFKDAIDCSTFCLMSSGKGMADLAALEKQT